MQNWEITKNHIYVVLKHFVNQHLKNFQLLLNFMYSLFCGVITRQRQQWFRDVVSKEIKHFGKTGTTDWLFLRTLSWKFENERDGYVSDGRIIFLPPEMESFRYQGGRKGGPRKPGPSNSWNNRVRFQQPHNQGLRQLFLTLFWDLCA